MGAGYLAGRAEVQQNQFIVPGQVQVARFDIPVHEAGLMHFLQATQYRQQQLDRPPLRQLNPRLSFSGRFQMPRQILAFVVVHHQIGGVVRLEEVHHPHQMRMTQLRDSLRFL